MITIRNFVKKARPWAIGALAGLILATSYGVFAQPGMSPNFAWLRGAALGSDPALVCQGLDVNVDCNIVPQGTGTLLINGAGIPGISGGAGTFASVTVNPGPLTVTGNSVLNGTVSIRPGTSAVTELLGGAVLFNSAVDFTPAAAAVEEDAYSFSLPANTLAADNQFLHVYWAATTAANANNKRARFYFGATMVCDSTAAGFNNQRLTANVMIWRTGAATQKVMCVGDQASETSWATAKGGGSNFTTPAENLAGAVIMRLTLLNATAAADSTARGINIIWSPAGQ